MAEDCEMSNVPVVAFENVSKDFELHRNVSAAFWAHVPLFNRLRKSDQAPREVKTALKELSFSIQPSEKVGVIGRNGSGKTTLLRLVSGQTSPSLGTITLNGQCQALMQTGFGFNPELTGLENIRNSLLYNGLDPTEHGRFIEDIIDFVELGEFIHYPLKTYSLGMHARLEFATATAIRPDVLIVDEVMGAGDGYFARKSAERMCNLVENSTLLLVSHSLAQINEFCDRVLWINDGVLMADGEAQEVIERYEVFMAEYNAARGVAVAQTNELSVARAADEAGEDIFQDSGVVIEKFRQMIETVPLSLQDGLSLRIRRSKTAQYVLCQVGGKLQLDLEVEHSVAAPARRALLCAWGFSNLGSYLFRALGPEFYISGNERLPLALTKSKLNVGIGDYLMFFGLICPDTGAILAIAEDNCKLRVPPTNYSDPPYVHLEGEWVYKGKPPESARIDAWV